MPRRETALVVDDDHHLRSLLSDMLHDAGFEVVECASGTDAVVAVTRHSPLVVTLDIGLPDMDGFETLRRIRSRSSCYVMMISGRDDEMDLLSSLHLGADEYITKPFRARELRARVHAMLRRPRMATLPPALGTDRGALRAVESLEAPPSPPPEHDGAGHGDAEGHAAAESHGAADSHAAPGSHAAADGAVTAGDGFEAAGPVYRPVPPDPLPEARRGVLSHLGLVLDPGRREVTAEGRPVRLTRMEFDLLHELLKAGGAVMTKNALIQALRDHEHEPGSPSGYVSTADEHALEVHMGNLRRKLGEKRGAPRWVMTVRGVGYRLTPRPPRH